MKTITVFNWEDITNTNEKIVEGPGLYSWYYVPHPPFSKVKKEDYNESLKNVKNLKEKEIRSKKTDDIDKNNIFYNTFYPLLPPHNDGKTISNKFHESTTYAPKDLLNSYIQPQYQMRLTRSYDKAATNMLLGVNRGFEEFIFSEIRQLIPCFFPPIYVGKADKLRKRVCQHKSLIDKLTESDEHYEEVRKAVEDVSDEEKDPSERKLLKAFGSQIAWMQDEGITLRENLILCCHGVNLKNYDFPMGTKTKDPLEALEGLINRIVSPSKGRR